MYSDISGSTSKVTTNTVGATYQFQSWLRSNNYHNLLDESGAQWSLKVVSHLGPNPNNTQGGTWDIRLEVSSSLEAGNLLKTKVLDEVEDKRLLALLGDGVVPIDLKRQGREAVSTEEARRFIAEEVGSVKRVLSSSNLSNIKRNLVGQWIDSRQFFK